MANRRRRAATIIEMVVGLGVATLVMALVWTVFSTMMGRRGGPDGAVAMTAESFLRQEALMGVEKLNRRLQEAIQIIDPKPGTASTTLVFRDILNNQVTVLVKSKTLVSIGPNGEERDAIQMTTPSGSKFTPILPIRIPHCAAAQFTAVSPTCVEVNLTIEGDGRAVTMVNTVELHNRNLAR